MALPTVLDTSNHGQSIPLTPQISTWHGKAWETGKEVATASLPFLTLYKPFSFPVALGMGALRVGTSAVGLAAALQEGDHKKIFSEATATMIAVISFAGTFFAHPLGILISTGYDLVIEIRSLIKHLREGNREEALKSCLKILSNSLYFSVFLCGGPEIAICFLAVQMLSGALEARHEFAKGNYVSGVGHALMTTLRGGQMRGQIKALQLKWELQGIVRAFQAIDPSDQVALSNYVGKLAEKWQFPSDHLPVGAKVGNAHVISWNVLNNHFMEWVTDRDSQGLNGSMISKLHDQKSLKYPGLTMRDELVASMLLQIMNSPAHGSHLILALQECSPEFVRVFEKMLPSHMGIVLSESPATSIDHNVVVYNKKTFQYLEKASTIATPFVNSDPIRPLMDLAFLEKATHQRFQIIHAHVPGAPDKPGRNEFAKYVLTHSKPHYNVIALGDMNFTDYEMHAAFNKEAAALHMVNAFKNLTDYNTNINPGTFTAKNIDHIRVKTGLPCETMKPNDVIPGLQATVDLLHPDDEVRHCTLQAAEKSEWIKKWYEHQQFEQRERLEDARRTQGISIV